MKFYFSVLTDTWKYI